MICKGLVTGAVRLGVPGSLRVCPILFFCFLKGAGLAQGSGFQVRPRRKFPGSGFVQVALCNLHLHFAIVQREHWSSRTFILNVGGGKVGEIREIIILSQVIFEGAFLGDGRESIKNFSWCQ